MFFWGALMLVAGGSARRKAESAAPAESSVQIVSIQVKPGTIHKELKPNAAQIIVVVRYDGPIAPGAEMPVRLGDYAGDPPGNHAIYPGCEMFRPLTKGTNILTCAVRGGLDTKTGSLIVAANIVGYYFPKKPGIKKPLKASGARIAAPLTPSAWQAKIKTVAP
jgi:hypothetical protein